MSMIFSAVVETFYAGLSNRAATGYTSHLKCDQYRELTFNFYFMLVNLNLNSHVS